MAEAATVRIAGRFNGPPDSGHGGYTAGLLAGFITGSAEITLRLPPPLERPLRVETDPEGGARLLDGDELVAEGRPAEPVLEVPESPGLEAARRAAEDFPGFRTHPLPGCFACGHGRAEGDGLRILSSPWGDAGLVAAPWLPDPSLADQDGRIAPEVVWAALDCPSGWAVGLQFLRPNFPPGSYILLGRMTAAVHHHLTPGEPCVTLGWPVSADGRKLSSGSAVFAPDGSLAAAASALWIAKVPES